MGLSIRGAAVAAALLLLFEMTPASAQPPADELRGTFACALGRAASLTSSQAALPRDVSQGPCAQEIAAVAGRGWIKDVRGAFRPQAALTRLDASIALVDALAVGPGSDMHQPSVRDARAIPKADWGYVNVALGLHMLGTLPGGYFRPGTPLTVPMAASALSALRRLAAPGFLVLRYAEGTEAPQPAHGTLQATTGQVLTFSVRPYNLAGGSPSWLRATYTILGPSGTVTAATGRFRSGVAGLFDLRADVPGYAGVSASIRVTPPHPTSLAVTAASSGTSGAPLTVTLTLRGPSGQPFPYSGQEPVSVRIAGDPTAEVPDTASFTQGVAQIAVVPSVGGVFGVSVSLGTSEGPLEGTSAPISVAAGNAVLVQSQLSAGGPLSASIPVQGVHVAWMLTLATGMDYPLFGSSSSTISQALPEDIPAGAYILTATLPGTPPGPAYSALVHISSSWHQGVTSSGRSMINPFDVYSAQDMIPILDAGIWGQGETIALYEASSVSASDIAAFDAEYGLPPADIQVISPDGPVPDNVSNGLAAEATMDLEWTHAMAPGATIVMYEYPTPSAATMAQTATAAQGKGYDVLSLSMGLSQDGSAQEDQAISSAVQHGLAIFASAGDHGQELPGRTRWPASNPSVVAVGGVQYDPGRVDYWDSNYDGQGVLWAGGWGTSDYAAPPWQLVLGKADRTLPDVSFLARDAAIYFVGQDTDSGGTSLGTPCWAGIWALADQAYRSAHAGQGIPTPAAQVIYNVATDTGAPAPAFFQATGSAQPLATTTGFGAPNVQAFIDDVLALP